MKQIAVALTDRQCAILAPPVSPSMRQLVVVNKQRRTPLAWMTLLLSFS